MLSATEGGLTHGAVRLGTTVPAFPVAYRPNMRPSVAAPLFRMRWGGRVRRYDRMAGRQPPRPLPDIDACRCPIDASNSNSQVSLLLLPVKFASVVAGRGGCSLSHSQLAKVSKSMALANGGAIARGQFRPVVRRGPLGPFRVNEGSASGDRLPRRALHAFPLASQPPCPRGKGSGVGCHPWAVTSHNS